MATNDWQVFGFRGHVAPPRGSHGRIGLRAERESQSTHLRAEGRLRRLTSSRDALVVGLTVIAQTTERFRNAEFLTQFGCGREGLCIVAITPFPDSISFDV